MEKQIAWLRSHKFESTLAAFLLITFPSGALYWAAQAGSGGWIIILITFIVTGNLLAIAVD